MCESRREKARVCKVVRRYEAQIEGVSFSMEENESLAAYGKVTFEKTFLIGTFFLIKRS